MGLICDVFESSGSVNSLDLHFSHPFLTKYAIAHIREMSDLVCSSMDRVSLHRVIFCMAKEIDTLNIKLDSIRDEYTDLISENDKNIEILKLEIQSLQKAPEHTNQVNFADTIKGLEKDLVRSVYVNLH